MKLRIGQGIDFHRLEAGLDLWLGGIKIKSEKGCVAHSDGDVLLHAVCDALLGACGSRDIGFHFPDTDNRYKGIDSKKLLHEVVQIVRSKGFTINNIDCTLCLEKPKIAPYIDEMRQSIAAITANDTEEISVKATTTEKMGFTGREEGVVAFAVVLLSKVE